MIISDKDIEDIGIKKKLLQIKKIKKLSFQAPIEEIICRD